MTRCRRCCMPDTRPDTPFVDGACAACLSYEKRPQIDWEARKSELVRLLEINRNDSGYDCIVPSSGGKDSTWQALTLIELGARPLVVTATTCMLTEIGRKNIDNLARFASTVEITPNRLVRAKLNRIGLRMVGDISWPEHVAIFTTPFKVACDFGIPLIFYGENPQNQYGGPLGTEEAKTMTRRWVSEFGGFLGLRASDLAGVEGLTERDMDDYQMPSDEAMRKVGVEAHFLGQYLPWDSQRNAEVSMDNGMLCELPSPANYWPYENLDNAMTGIHDHMMYRKYGYGRFAAQISVDIRRGKISRDEAMELVRKYDGIFPHVYADVHINDVLSRIGMSAEELLGIIDKFTNWDLFSGCEDLRPVLKEWD